MYTKLTLNKIVFGILVLLSPLVTAMSIFDAGKACVFSAVSGTITYQGQPVSGATVTRTAKWQSEKSDQITTDENGHFEFPSLFSRSVAKALPMQFVSTETIMVNHQGEDIRIWFGSKLSPDEFSESRGKPIQLKCELTNPQEGIPVNGQVFLTICEWDVERDEPLSFDDAFSDE